MKPNWKELWHLTEALEFRIAAYKRELESLGEDDDRCSDIENDLMYLDALVKEYKKDLHQIELDLAAKHQAPPA